MSEENPGASSTAGETQPLNTLSPQELRKVLDTGSALPADEKETVTVSPDSIGRAVEVAHRFTGLRSASPITTTEFVSTAAGFRYDVLPTPWYVVVRDVAALYGTFVGLPAAAAIWAIWKVWQITNGG